MVRVAAPIHLTTIYGRAALARREAGAAAVVGDAVADRQTADDVADFVRATWMAGTRPRIGVGQVIQHIGRGAIAAPTVATGTVAVGDITDATVAVPAVDGNAVVRPTRTTVAGRAIELLVAPGGTGRGWPWAPRERAGAQHADRGSEPYRSLATPAHAAPTMRRAIAAAAAGWHCNTMCGAPGSSSTRAAGCSALIMRAWWATGTMRSALPAR